MNETIEQVTTDELVELKAWVRQLPRYPKPCNHIDHRYSDCPSCWDCFASLLMFQDTGTDATHYRTLGEVFTALKGWAAA